jgi:hypothetical protein
MIVSVGSHALTVPPHTSFGTRRLPPDEVQGVIVNPPRDSRVAVRVEVVTEDEPRQQPRAAEREPLPQAYAFEAALLAANLEASQAASKLGTSDARRATAAYSAHADWRRYDVPGQRDAPKFLDVRA